MATLSQKMPLPDSRSGVTRRFEIGGIKVYATVNVVDDRPVEMFLKLARPGTLERGLADGLGRMISLGLRYGVPVQDIISQFRYSKFEPSGMVEGEQGFYSSVLDYLAAWMEKRWGKPVEAPPQLS